MPVKAVAKEIRTSPRKVRLVADTVRGRRVDEALEILRFLPTPVAATVAKVVRSAAANAENNLMLNPDGLRIVGIYADAGTPLRRVRASSRGRAGKVRKRSTHITVIVDTEGA